MKIFDVVSFLVFVEENEDVYFNESYGERAKKSWMGWARDLQFSSCQLVHAGLTHQ